MNKNEQSINQCKETITTKNKDINFDLLRILLAFMVVILHVSAGVLLQSDINSNTFRISTYFNHAVRASVPLFIMISGYFNVMKDPDPTLGKILKKMIWLFSIFLAWSCFYAFNHMLNSHHLFQTDISIRRFIELLSAGQYHLWFIPVLISCYALSPLLFALKKYEDGKTIKYFILLFFLFGILKNSLSTLLTVTEHLTLNSVLNRFTVISLNNYFYYYLLGYYLSKYNFKIRMRWLIALFILITTFNSELTIYFSKISNQFVDKFISNFFLSVFLQATLIFKMFQTLKSYPFLERHTKTISKFSGLTLGIYLIHPIFVDMLKDPSLDNMRENPLFIPTAGLGIFFLSAGISFIIKKIPGINKLI